MKFKFYNYLFWPPKKPVFGFEKKPPNNCFFVFWPWFSFKNNGHTNVLQVGIFENALKKLWISCQERHFGRLWWLLTFSSAYSKILTKTTCVGLLFFTQIQKKNMKKSFKSFFFKTQKHFLGDQPTFLYFFSFSLKTNVDLVNIWSMH